MSGPIDFGVAVVDVELDDFCAWRAGRCFLTFNLRRLLRVCTLP